MSRGPARRRSTGFYHVLLFGAVGVLAPAGGCGKLAAQLRLEHFDVTAGTAAERYTGKFSIVTVPIVDSADHAIAWASEWAFTSNVGLLSRPNRSLTVAADGALRQLATAGFLQRNYAPREHSYRVTALYQQNMARGTLRFIPAVEGRNVTDLPPMPLYLTPGNLAYSARVAFARPLDDRHAVDVGMALNEKDYAGPSVLPDLDLLDFRSLEVEAGVARRFRGSSGPSDVRLFLAYLRHRYRKQGHRSDDALRIGGSWQLDWWEAKGLQIDFNTVGTLNRSNSSRVEYNVLKVEAEAQKNLGDDYIVTLSGTWSGKSYVNPQEFLVPGEEADNHVALYGEVTRILSANVDAIIGGGWTRAETNISGDYYERFRLSFSLRASPRF